MARKKGSKHYCDGCLKYLPKTSFGSKGHKRHLCKKCIGVAEQFGEEWELVYSLLESGVPYEFIEEYLEKGFYEYDLYKSVKLNPEIYDVLQRLNGKGSIHHIIHDNLVLSFYLTGAISIEKAAHLLEMGIVEFIGILDFYQLPWVVTYDANAHYQQSSDHLLEMVDNMIEITK